MRISGILLVLALIAMASSHSYACSNSLKKFSFECEVQDQFLKLKTDFKANWGVNIGDISVGMSIVCIEVTTL